MQNSRASRPLALHRRFQPPQVRHQHPRVLAVVDPAPRYGRRLSREQLPASAFSSAAERRGGRGRRRITRRRPSGLPKVVPKSVKLSTACFQQIGRRKQNPRRSRPPDRVSAAPRPGSWLFIAKPRRRTAPITRRCGLTVLRRSPFAANQILYMPLSGAGRCRPPASRGRRGPGAAG